VQASYFVLSTTVSPNSLNTPIAEITELFIAKFPDYKITDVTGWGGVNLIIFNTEKASGGTGPSFWFEVPGGGFIRLSTKFN
jgi:hypothetical protein